MKLIAVAALSAVLYAIGQQAIASDLELNVLDRMGTSADTYQTAAQEQETQGISGEPDVFDWPDVRDAAGDAISPAAPVTPAPDFGEY